LAVGANRSRTTARARQRSVTDPIETELERDLRASVEIANAKKKDAGALCLVPVSSDEPIPLFAPTPQENGNGNGDHSQVASDGNGHPASTTKLERALKTAISAAYNAEKYGTELGYVVRFDADAIKSMAVTVLINMSEGGRR
jgi:hypothetical protein